MHVCTYVHTYITVDKYISTCVHTYVCMYGGTYVQKFSENCNWEICYVPIRTTKSPYSIMDSWYYVRMYNE